MSVLNVCMWRPEERVRPLELAVVSHLTWVLGTEFLSFARATALSTTDPLALLSFHFGSFLSIIKSKVRNSSLKTPNKNVIEIENNYDL